MAKRLELVISGNARGALAAMTQVNAGAGRMSGGVGRAGMVAAGAFAAVGVAAGAAAVGIGAALAAIGSEFDSAYDKIRVNTGATGEALAGLEGSVREIATNVPTSIGNVGTAVAAMNQRFGLTGPALEGAAEQMLNLSRITETDLTANIEAAQGALGTFGIGAGELQPRMDQMFRAFQQSGVPVDRLGTQLQQFGPTLQGLGFGFEESLGMIAQFEEAGIDMASTMPGLTRSLSTFAQAGEAPAATFERMVDGFKNGTLDMGDAFEMFGSRAGARVFTAIQNGTFDIESMTDAISGGSDTINDAADDTADWNEKLMLLRNNILVKLEPIAMAVFNAIGSAVESITPEVRRLSAQIGPMVQQAADWLGVRLPQALDWLRAKAEEIWPVLREFLVGVYDAVRENWPEIRDTVIEVMSGIAETISGVVDTVTTLWNRFGDDILAGASERFGAVVQQLRGAFNIIAGLVNTVMAVFRGDWGAAWDGIKQIFTGVWDFIVGWLRLMWSNIGAIFRMAGELLGQTWFSIWHGIRDFFVGIWDGIVSAIRGYWDLFMGFWRFYLGNLSAVWSSIWNGIKGVTSSVWGAITGTVRTALDGVKRAVQLAVDAIARIWRGLKNIFKGVANWVVDNVVNAFIGGVNAVAGAIGIGDLLDEIPRFHSGGVMGGGTGQEGLAVLQGGEGILPVAAMAKMSPGQFEMLRQGKTDAIGDGLGFVGDIASAVADAVRAAAANVARPAVNSALGMLEDIAPGVPGEMLGGTARSLGDRVLTWISGVETLAKSVAAPVISGGADQWKSMWQTVQRQFPWATLHSGFRPGAITATGNRSYHSMGRAVDLTPSMVLFDWLRSNYMAQTKELIFSPANGRQVHNGRDHMYSGITRSMHWDHVHWAMGAGGDFVVRKPTTFIAGDNGPERATFTPLGAKQTARGGDIHMHFHGPVNVDEEWLATTTASARRKGLIP